MAPKLDSETQRLAMSLLCCEIVRLKSLCYKASENIRVEDDASQNLYNALRFKTSEDYSNEYSDLRSEIKSVGKELESIFGPLIESYEDYIAWSKSQSKE